MFGLRATNEPLTTDATLRRTARTAKYEKTQSDNARKTRKTTKRTADDNAGQPGTANAALPTRSQKATCAMHYKGRMLCRLTPEVTGAKTA